MVRADRKRRGKRHPDVTRRRAHVGEPRHALPVLDAPPERFVKIAVAETAVAGQQDRAAREGDVVLEFVGHDGHVEPDFNDVAKLPFALNRDIGPGHGALLLLAVHFHNRRFAPLRNAQLERHDARVFGVADDPGGVRARIERVHVEGDLLAGLRNDALHQRGRVEVENRRVARRAEEPLEEAEEAPRAVRRAAVRVHVAVMLAVIAVAGERRVAGEFRAVRLHRAEIGIVEGALDLIRPLRVARQVEQLLAKAHPRRCDARLLETQIRQVLLARAVEPRF
ncbi:MAG: hypothetical protein BWX70_03047 [Verrucomicrobia bacterium ADurb.Bin070]|nr:MAG: hypothetical protein BWX70_03047 [Verrucomicrobia bacterium ADurb.Bin070]